MARIWAPVAVLILLFITPASTPPIASPFTKQDSTSAKSRASLERCSELSWARREFTPTLLGRSDGLPVHGRGVRVKAERRRRRPPLEGHSIEIRGAVKLYDGRAEIILNRISQITGGAAMIPPLPKNYDVENRGHYSAGYLRPTRKPAKTKATPSTMATYGNDVEGEDLP